MARKQLARDEVMDRLGVSVRTLFRLIDEGLPVTGKGESATFPWPECRRWYDKRLQSQVTARPANLEEAKARRESALAQQEELKLAEMRGELMTATEYRRVVDDTNSRIAARLKALPQKLAPAVVGVKDTSEGLACVQPLVDEVMEELFAAEDVPTEEAA